MSNRITRPLSEETKRIYGGLVHRIGDRVTPVFEDWEKRIGLPGVEVHDGTEPPAEGHDE